MCVSKPLTFGVYNRNFSCCVAGSQDAIVVRIINSRLDTRLLCRYQRVCTMLHTQPTMSPPVSCHFLNGTCTDFIYGRTLFKNFAERGRIMRDPNIVRYTSSLVFILNSLFLAL